MISYDSYRESFFFFFCFLARVILEDFCHVRCFGFFFEKRTRVIGMLFCCCFWAPKGRGGEGGFLVERTLGTIYIIGEDD